jgi:hypothetical protein
MSLYARIFGKLPADIVIDLGATASRWMPDNESKFGTDVSGVSTVFDMMRIIQEIMTEQGATGYISFGLDYTDSKGLMAKRVRQLAGLGRDHSNDNAVYFTESDVGKAPESSISYFFKVLPEWDAKGPRLRIVFLKSTPTTDAIAKELAKRLTPHPNNVLNYGGGRSKKRKGRKTRKSRKTRRS